MPERQDEILDLVVRSLDGDVNAEERAEVERALEADPALRAGVEALVGAERELRGMYDGLKAPGGVASPREGASRRWLGAAAAVLAACAVWWFMFGVPERVEPLDARMIHQTFAVRPVPSVVCDTPEKFRAYTTEKLGQEIDARFDSPVQLIGWRGVGSGRAYEEATGDSPRLLLARSAGGRPVAVLFQPASHPEPLLDPSAGLRLFSVRFGDVDAWEITPETDAQVLGVLSAAP